MKPRMITITMAAVDPVFRARNAGTGSRTSARPPANRHGACRRRSELAPVRNEDTQPQSAPTRSTRGTKLRIDADDRRQIRGHEHLVGIGLGVDAGFMKITISTSLVPCFRTSATGRRVRRRVLLELG